MREIKFRGLRVDGKGWVYGDLVINKPTRATRIVSDFGLCTSSNYTENGLDHCTGNFSNVIPKTVGQLTGLKDKNGVDIYEEDLIAHKFYSTPVAVSYKNGSFVADDVSIFSNSIEVIGNIHESKI